MVEAGFIGRLSLCASESPLPVSGTTLTPMAVAGTPAAFNAVATLSGSDGRGDWPHAGAASNPTSAMTDGARDIHDPRTGLASITATGREASSFAR